MTTKSDEAMVSRISAIHALEEHIQRVLAYQMTNPGIDALGADVLREVYTLKKCTSKDCSRSMKRSRQQDRR